MKDRPILFSSPMVRAILDGRKTQTRRVVKFPPTFSDKSGTYRLPVELWGPTKVGGAGTYRITKSGRVPVAEMTAMWNPKGATCIGCCYGKPGDRLWVRETWQATKENWVMYAANSEMRDTNGKAHGCLYQGPWLPSIHMPRWASRITLEITKVRVERLQEITEEDAIAEGCVAEHYNQERIDDLQISDAHPNVKALAKALGPGCVPARADYWHLWDKINSKKHPWAGNPFVWVIEFRRIQHGKATVER